MRLAFGTLRYSRLRLSLILPFVALIALLTGMVGVLWYWTGTRTISNLSQQLMDEMVERISLAIDSNVHMSGAMLETAFPTGLPAGPDIAQDLPALRQRLWAATSLSGRTGDYVHYGNIAGQSIGLLRTNATQAEVRLKTREQDPRTYYRLDGITGTPEPTSVETATFDPRTRPWFVAARKAQGDVWTPIYIDFNSRFLVMTRSRRVLSASGAFEGAVATDLFLDALQKFVAELPITSGGQAMILEPDGSIVAISGMPNVRTLPDGTPERVHIDYSGNSALAATFNALRQSFDTSTPGHRESIAVDVQGQAVQVAYQRISDTAGLNWLAVVALPHKDMLAGIRRDVTLMLALGLLVLGVALMIGWRIFGGLASDMRQLATAVRRVGQGDIDTPITVARNDEIGELARNFRHMRHSLFTDPLTGLNNRGALQRILEALTRPSPGQAPSPFALLFIDLDRFKPLNDRWGHDNGDLALIEVAQRLRERLRADDIVTRLGGDEFVAVVRGIDSDSQARATCEQLQEAITQPLRTLQGAAADVSATVDATIGYALYPRDATDPSSLLKYADEDMYRHKASSRAQ
jgi:diguanylate cyclase (GGDEF)-like protein